MKWITLTPFEEEELELSNKGNVDEEGIFLEDTNYIYVNSDSIDYMFRTDEGVTNIVFRSDYRERPYLYVRETPEAIVAKGK